MQSTDVAYTTKHVRCAHIITNHTVLCAQCALRTQLHTQMMAYTHKPDSPTNKISTKTRNRNGRNEIASIFSLSSLYFLSVYVQCMVYFDF